MKVVTVTIKHRVSTGPECGVCRFCVKGKQGHTCALYNMPLMSMGNVAQKYKDCITAVLKS